MFGVELKRRTWLAGMRDRVALLFCAVGSARKTGGGRIVRPRAMGPGLFAVGATGAAAFRAIVAAGSDVIAPDISCCGPFSFSSVGAV